MEKELEKEGIDEEEKGLIKKRIATFESRASAYFKANVAGDNFKNWEFVGYTPIDQCFVALI